MARISRYNHETKRLEWVEASDEEYQAWRAARAAKQQGGAKKPAKGKPATPRTEKLDESDGPEEPTGPKRASGVEKPKSLLAPILPRLARMMVQGVQQFTYNMTRGVAPMTRTEAIAIAVPVVRIADRTIAKYIKKTGKVTPNQEDFALIALTVTVWGIGWITASIAGKKAQPAPVQTAPIPHIPDSDVYAGSEPVAAGDVSPSAAAAPVPSPDASDDGGADIFSGSEPLGPGLAATPPRTNGHIDPTRARVAEATWQALMPTDVGYALAE